MEFRSAIEFGCKLAVALAGVPVLGPSKRAEGYRAAFEKSLLPKVCLIIDDGGYQEGKALSSLYGFKVPATLSLIPGLEYSEALAREAPEHGVEVMCHLPMAGHEKVRARDYRQFLKEGIKGPEAARLVREALDSLPGCKGLNNHMGSRATVDLKLMEAVCRVLKERNLYFVDSRTSDKSVAWKAAKKTKVLFSVRDVFLDNKEEPRAIQLQLNALVQRARKRGWAVGIGHFKALTLKTLEKAVHRLERQGVQFVYASEIVAWK